MSEETYVSQLVAAHLKSKTLLRANPAWAILKSSYGGGRGLFATRDIEAGEIIFVDHPVLIGPKLFGDDLCVVCYKKSANIKNCARNCGLRICSSNCENSRKHIKECDKINSWKSEDKKLVPREIIDCLMPIKAIFLSDMQLKLIKSFVAHSHPRHGIEVEVLKAMDLKIGKEERIFLRDVCEILDANCYEVMAKGGAVRGLYSIGCFLNHSCVPNTMQIFNSKLFMIVRASRKIKQGEEIYNSYTRLIWSTINRRKFLLSTKHFFCKCPRCNSPDELGTSMGAILCPSCSQNTMTPLEPSRPRSTWKCLNCDKVFEEEDISFVTTALSEALGSFRDDQVWEILKYYENKIRKIVPESNQIAVEVKNRVIFILGRSYGYLYQDLSLDLLLLKQKFCSDVLEIIDRLGVGLRKMRALVLYELITCKREIFERKIKRDNNNSQDINMEVFEDEINRNLDEICNICLFGDGAPEEVQAMWKKRETKTDWRDYY